MVFSHRLGTALLVGIFARETEIPDESVRLAFHAEADSAPCESQVLASDIVMTEWLTEWRPMASTVVGGVWAHFAVVAVVALIRRVAAACGTSKRGEGCDRQSLGQKSPECWSAPSRDGRLVGKRELVATGCNCEAVLTRLCEEVVALQQEVRHLSAQRESWQFLERELKGTASASPASSATSTNAPPTPSAPSCCSQLAGGPSPEPPTTDNDPRALAFQAVFHDNCTRRGDCFRSESTRTREARDAEDAHSGDDDVVVLRTAILAPGVAVTGDEADVPADQAVSECDSFEELCAVAVTLPPVKWEFAQLTSLQEAGLVPALSPPHSRAASPDSIDALEHELAGIIAVNDALESRLTPRRCN